jgi:hypothetical protein
VFALEVIGILRRVADESGEFDISTLGDVASATYLLLAASSIALLWRRSRPLIVLMVTLTASLVWDVIGLAGGASLAIFISLYGVALVRNTGGAVTGTILLLIILPPLAVQMVNETARWVPSILANVVSGIDNVVGMGAAIVAIGMWALVPAAIGLVAVTRRDVV